MGVKSEGHPFTGEFEGKDYAIHPNGVNSSARLRTSYASTNNFKHDRVTYAPKRSLSKQLNELVFGKSFEDKLFEKNVKESLSTAGADMPKAYRHRLKA
jgi:hypothetical protein